MKQKSPVFTVGGAGVGVGGLHAKWWFLSSVSQLRCSISALASSLSIWLKHRLFLFQRDCHVDRNCWFHFKDMSPWEILSPLMASCQEKKHQSHHTSIYYSKLPRSQHFICKDLVDWADILERGKYMKCQNYSLFSKCHLKQIKL